MKNIGETGKPLTLRDISVAAGVSKATVSNVLNDKPGVGRALRKKIQKIIKAHRYAPRPSARHLSLNRADTLAALFIDITPGWLLTVYRAALGQALEMKYNMVTALSSHYGDEFELPTSVLGTIDVDGLVWFDPRVQDKLVLRFRRLHAIPFVLIQSHVRVPGVTTISIENERGAYHAVQHLVGLGRKRFMFITGQPDNPDSNERMRGAQRALQDARIKISPTYILNGQNTKPDTLRPLTDFFQSGRHAPPDAIFAFNDTMALTAMRFLRSKRIRVPEDVAIVGFDGIDEAKEEGLTTIETPVRELGIMATKTLVEMIQKPETRKVSRNFILEGALWIGKSCGATK